MIIFKVTKFNEESKQYVIDQFNEAINVEDIFKEICMLYEKDVNEFDLTVFLNSHDCEIINDVKDDTPISMLIDIKYNKMFLEFNISNSQHLMYSRIYYNIKNFPILGNCVDKFIIKALSGKLYTIKNYINDIKSRSNDRAMMTEYHQSACYENDYFVLCSIQNTLKEMLEYCNKQVEQMSDKYTKLN